MGSGHLEHWNTDLRETGSEKSKQLELIQDYVQLQGFILLMLNHHFSLSESELL
jgi:hypothetical protein